MAHGYTRIAQIAITIAVVLSLRGYMLYFNVPGDCPPPPTASPHLTNTVHLLDQITDLEFARNIPDTPLRICIATHDFIGPIANGGIGTAYHALARTLVAAGHNVTVLFILGQHSEGVEPFSHWVKLYSHYNIRLIPMPASGHTIYGSWYVKKAHDTYMWLRHHQDDFDVVHFHEWRGSGIYCLLARRLGLAFSNTVFVTGLHSPFMWHKVSSMEFVDSPDEIETEYMERLSIQHTDYLVSPSQYMVDWLVSKSYTLPDKVLVQPNLMMPAPQRIFRAAQIVPTKELVFFGRLEVRKGLFLFLNALEMVEAERPDLRLSVTFLGKNLNHQGQVLLSQQELVSRLHTTTWRILSDKDNKEAKAYLSEKGTGRVAMMPSLIDNSPYTVMECLVIGIPFMASRVGGIPELIHPEDVNNATFALNARAIADAIVKAMTAGVKIARPSPVLDDNVISWEAWHQYIHYVKTHPKPPIISTPLALPDANSHSSAHPLVSVIISTYNRPRFLADAITSLQRQDYPNFEVILVDDGSTSREAITYLQTIQPEFAKRGWKIKRQINAYLGAARNNGARYAAGTFLMFMDDDNVAKFNEISTFVKAALTLEAEARPRKYILTSLIDIFYGEEVPLVDEWPAARYLPVGGHPGIGLVRNTFGDANMMVRKSTFDYIGGFSTLYGVGFEDWELFNKATLAGVEVVVVPEALFWKREAADDNMLLNTNSFANYNRIVQPYVAKYPELEPAFLYLQSMVTPKKETDVAAAKPDFSSSQGNNGWHYGVATAGVPGTFQPLQWHARLRQWHKPDLCRWLMINEYKMHPCIVRGTSYTPVLRYESNMKGAMTISGEVAKNAQTCGDGVNVTIARDDVTIWQAHIMHGNMKTFSLQVKASVGTKVDISVSPLASADCDTLLYGCKISFAKGDGPDPPRLNGPSTFMHSLPKAGGSLVSRMLRQLSSVEMFQYPFALQTRSGSPAAGSRCTSWQWMWPWVQHIEPRSGPMRVAAVPASEADSSIQARFKQYRDEKGLGRHAYASKSLSSLFSCHLMDVLRHNTTDPLGLRAYVNNHGGHSYARKTKCTSKVTFVAEVTPHSPAIPWMRHVVGEQLHVTWVAMEPKHWVWEVMHTTTTAAAAMGHATPDQPQGRKETTEEDTIAGSNRLTRLSSCESEQVKKSLDALMAVGWELGGGKAAAVATAVRTSYMLLNDTSAPVHKLLAARWVLDAARTLSARTSLPKEDFLLVRYEDIVKDPSVIAEKMLRFLGGLPMSSQMRAWLNRNVATQNPAGIFSTRQSDLRSDAPWHQGDYASDVSAITAPLLPLLGY
eukprot:TRINITY_DN2039_c0_g1_i3.p1 TRINITY_DN2039_c0_g1~~TRINITY_DN2039_c0_g1_i3.p1  ORF type:complete len:1334 (-),score=355.24 TRINITY_DN2039_c0_g1_i3:206-4135(-)